MTLWRSLLGALVAVMLWLPAAGAVDIKPVTTPLGLTAWLVQDKSAPVVSLAFSFAGGAASDPRGQSGVTNLMATLLTDGAGPLAFQAFQRRQEDAAASLGFSASLDRLGGTLRVLSANREEGFELLRLALTQPRFDADMVDQRRAQIVAALNQARERPASVAARTLMATEFAGHPYANDRDGTADDLKTVTPQILKQRAGALLMRSGLIVAAVGDIDEAELGRLLDRAFGSLPLGTPLALSLDSSSAVASLLHSMQVDNLPPDHLTRRANLIGAVKIDDVRRIARRLLPDEAATTVVVGKPVGITVDP
ncbi:MAG TPA: insulinase family protein [Reyranella sp.]